MKETWYKKIITITTVVVLVELSILSTLSQQVTSSLSSYNNKETTNLESTNIQKIELSDDAFHGTQKYLSVEWWYFDALLNDGYSLHAGFKVYSLRNLGVVYPIIEIYKDKDLLVRALKPYSLNRLSASTIYPSVKVDGQSIIEFDLQEFNTTGRWKYTVTIQINNHGVNLTFTGTTEGWKYSIYTSEEWAVVLPKAEVSGTITIDGETKNITGRGYHDHNWNFTLGTKIREWGWYWGRLTGEKYTLICAWFIKSPFKFDNLVILNKDDSGYIEINPKDIQLSFSNYTWKNGMRIPSNFKISVENTSVKVDVVMNTLTLHLIGHPIVYYWRYFINVNGFIYLNDEIEDFIDSVQIFEIMKF